MKRILLILLVCIPIVFAQNETTNQTTNDTSIWYEDYAENLMGGDSLTLLAVLVGLVFVYFFGKIAFKLIKWVIIIVAILLLLRTFVF